jgi:beta-1,4-mannosyltransferase
MSDPTASGADVTTTVACIIPTHDRAHFLVDALASAAAQTVAPTEIIVVSDVPDEATADAVTAFAAATSIPVTLEFSRGGGGASASRNRGAELSGAQLLAFLDDDDTWEPGFLERSIRALDSSGSTMAVSWLSMFMLDKVKDGPAIPAGLTAQDVVLVNPGVTGSNMVVSRTAFDSVGGFDSTLKMKNDTDFFYRYLKSGGTYTPVTERLVNQRKHGSGQLTGHSVARAENTEAYYRKHRDDFTRRDRRQLRFVLHRIRSNAAPSTVSRIRHKALALLNYSPAQFRSDRANKADREFFSVPSITADASAPAGEPSGSAQQRPPVTVLHVLTAPDGTTRFVDQMVEGAPPEVEAALFGWRRALLGRYDVLHVHWPEQLLRSGSRSGRLKKRIFFRLLLLRLRLIGRPIVRTLHNVQPHEAGDRAEQRLLRALDQRTDLFIKLNATTQLPAQADTVTILHGHYRHRFEPLADGSTTRGRLLYFGLIRPYKGVDVLIEEFAKLADPDLQLRIVGRPSAAMAEVVTAAETHDPRISSVLRFVSDAELVAEVKQAELIVLPYREMHNSGVVLVALSLARPVLVPRTPSNQALADEVGDGWVHQFDAPLTAETIRSTLHALQASPAVEPPRLENRDWNTVGEAHYQAYLQAIRRRRG